MRTTLLAATAVLAFSGSAMAATDVDLVIENARIVDGSGNPWYRGSVAIDDGVIVQIGRNLDVNAQQTIDAKSRVLAPGFIDVHTHIESGITDNPRADNFILDGVTTVVTGNCGSSTVDLPSWRQSIVGPAINIATLVGHNSVRTAVMGRENRAPTQAEMLQMERLAEQAMIDGAVGLSTGLLYVPGTFASTDEVISLAKVSSRFGGIYSTHIRDQGPRLNESIEEAVTIGREADIPVQISHLKIKGPIRWGRINETIGLIEEFRADGIEVTVDAYPYERASTSLAVMLPSWATAGSADDLLARLDDSETYRRILEEMEVMRTDSGYPDFSFATVASYPPNPAVNGLTISEINVDLERPATIASEMELILQMMADSARLGRTNGAQMVYHFMSKDDVDTIFRYPNTAVASDGGVREFGEGIPHPRSYGTNARVLAEFVRERNVLSLPDAIRRMTSLPAQAFQMQDRGLIRTGFVADLVLFDPDQVQDLATYSDPHNFSRGFDYVLVNGVAVVEKGQVTNSRPGQFVDGPGAR
ncbi:N-acyl-D-amino-acid deacylase family protein [Woeseia oceani]|nr:D-aminoacylase [Woeseia oceani]